MAKVEMISVSLSEAADAIKFCIKAGRNVYIEGPAGVGKTELVAQVTAELGGKLFTTRLAQVEPADLVGFPMPEKVGNDYIMTFSRPTNIPPADDTDQLYIWFFDELNRANKQAINAVMQATDSCRKVGAHKLPKNTVVIGAGNPANDDAYDTSMLDAAANNRYVHIKVHYDAKALVAYAKKKEWHSNVVSFVQVTGSKIFKSNGYDGLPFCSPRSLEALNDMEKSGLGKDRAMHALLVQGCIGPELGAMYHAHCFELQPLKWIELGTKDGKTRLGRMLQPENIRQDLISFTNDDIVEHFKKQGGMSDKEFDTLSDYMTTIPADQSAALLAQLNGTSQIVDAFRAHLAAKGQAIATYLGKTLK
jgi:hypothetical protein